MNACYPPNTNVLMGRNDGGHHVVRKGAFLNEVMHLEVSAQWAVISVHENKDEAVALLKLLPRTTNTPDVSEPGGEK